MTPQPSHARATLALDGRVAVVTGAGTGIGSAIALGLARAGADVALHYRGHGGRASEIADQCRVVGRRAVVLKSDFSVDPAGAATIVEQAVEALGRVDILVNNAAVTTREEPFQEVTQAHLEETLAVNVTAPLLATQAAARHMVAQGSGGRIVNIGSVHSRVTNPNTTAYAVSKGALAALTQAAAVALGESGITVNCIAPGAVVVERYASVERFDEAWYVGRTPIGRLGTPDDVAAAVVFLATAQAGFVTGQTVFVDGGMSRRNPYLK